METISLTTEELDALVKRVKSGCLQEGDAEIIQAMANAVKLLSQAVKDKASSIKKLLAMVFGPKTKKKEKVLKPRTSGNPKKDKPVPKEGHGRSPGEDFTGAERKSVPHEALNHKAPCPLCPKGILYRLKKPGQAIYFTGQVPIDATIYDLEKLRCNLCGEVFTAQAPRNKTGRDYDASAMAMIPLLKYGCGFPWSRLAKLQERLGIPLAATTQWDKTEAAVNLIHPVFRELIRQAAHGIILHNDDTPMKILSLVQENKNITVDERTGMFTTGIISRIDDDRQIALFYTGRNHAGENITDLYRKRDPGRPPPVQMCDALSRNTTDEFSVILCNCLIHGQGSMSIQAMPGRLEKILRSKKKYLVGEKPILRHLSVHQELLEREPCWSHYERSHSSNGFFVDAGALTWPHGLELSPSRLHQICRHYKMALSTQVCLASSLDLAPGSGIYAVDSGLGVL